MNPNDGSKICGAVVHNTSALNMHYGQIEGAGHDGDL